MSSRFRTLCFPILICFLVIGQDQVSANDICTWTGSWDNLPDEATDVIVVAGGADLTWSNAHPDTVATWTQLSTFTNVVTFETGYTVFTNFTITGDCTISNGNWTHPPNHSQPASNRIAINIGGNLLLASNATIAVDSRGYLFGPGRSTESSGASHGGRGGLNAGTRGPTYGSLVLPDAPGSGSGGAHRGGGMVRLRVSGTSTVEGSISADGQSFTLLQGSGSGGSIFLETLSLTGSGSITANGGSGDFAGGFDVQSGGGGRIAVVLTGSSSPGTVSLQTHGGTYEQAGGGTVYVRSQGQSASEGSLILDNASASGDATTISSNVTDASVGEVQIQADGNLRILAGQRLDVARDWSNDGSFAAESGSTLALTTTNAGSFEGDSSFQALVVSNISKTLTFESGRTIAVSEALHLTGDGMTNLILKSSSPGLPWLLNVDAAVQQCIAYVDVSDSDASPGATVSTLFSADSGNNSNWLFATAGVTNTWLGTQSSDWGDGGNWSRGRSPILKDVKVIISNAPFAAIMPSAQAFADLVVDTGATLDLAGHNLAVSGDADINGTLVAQSAESLRFLGDIDWSGASFVASTSVVSLAGMGTQTMNSAAVSFHTFLVTNPGRSVVFLDALRSTVLRTDSVNLQFNSGISNVTFTASSEDGAMSIHFAASSTNTIRDLLLLGEAGNAITLASSAPGTTWFLHLLRRPCVRYVHVTDSDAGGGETIYPRASVNGGGNVNWVFGANVLAWNGSLSSDFATAENWTPGIVPDATARVVIDGDYTNAPVIAAAQSVLELQLGCHRPSELRVNHRLYVGEDITIYGFGQLIANAPISISNDFTVLAPVNLASVTNITHDDNFDTGLPQTNRVDVTVGKDLALDEGVTIDVTARGYANGPGGGSGASGGSHGGQGGMNTGALGPTYGSALAPIDPGSGGGGTAHSGGGAVILHVSGHTALDGAIVANGEDFRASIVGAGSGGSVYLRTATMDGTGTISANGGEGDFADSSDVQSGGGGRISIVLTASETFGSVDLTVHGGSYERPAAGTIYRERSSESSGRGTLTIENGSQQTQERFTTIPGESVHDVTELEDVTIVVTNFAWMQVATSLIVEVLHIISEQERLDLGDADHVLTLERFRVNGTTRNRVGTYRTNDWNGFPTPPNAGGEGVIRIEPQLGSILEFE